MTKVTNSGENNVQIKLSSTIEDYLIFFYILERDGEPVVGSRLAELLGVTPPTVTNTLKRMARDGLISMDESGTHLTELGRSSARTVMRRHMLMEWMMARMLPWSKLHSEAHTLEHAISNMAESALMEELNHPLTCPHGNPLPGNEAYVAGWVPLMHVPVGENVTIRRVHELAEENTELLSFLEEKGIMPGRQATVAEVLDFNQTITLDVQEKPVTLGFAAAKYVFVERGGGYSV
jgi:DtxR family Mn-dependent transcriptional regulator